jgi:type I restriction enzyme R subunit
MAKRFKKSPGPIKVVIVRDMWLTGFDAPSLHTMYIDKPMKGPWFNAGYRPGEPCYKDKSGGLVVDYLGLP